MSKTITDPQDPYVFGRMEGRADDATPLDLAAYRRDPELAEIESLMAENRLLLAQIAALTRPVHDTQTGQDETGAKNMGKSVSDFVPVCKHHFDYFPARYHWLDFRCVYCGFTLEPDDLCKMLDAGQLARVMDTAPVDAAIRARFAEGGEG